MMGTYDCGELPSRDYQKINETHDRMINVLADADLPPIEVLFVLTRIIAAIGVMHGDGIVLFTKYVATAVRVHFKQIKHKLSADICRDNVKELVS